MRPLWSVAGLLAAACAPMDVRVPFEAQVGGSRAACDVGTALGTTGTTARLADARLFVSGLELRDDEGTWVPLELTDSPWQQPGLALLDFEDGSGACADSGTTETNRSLLGTLPQGRYDALRFDVGVPFDVNHLDSATAPAPLNAPGMFWAWQSGYKFVRVDWMITGGEIPRWNVHIGSGGCASEAPVVSPEAPCDRPNLATIVIDDFDPGADTVDLELAALVAEADVASNTPDSPPGCMSSPTEPAECTPVFGSLGLDFATGDCTTDCLDQTVFSRR